MKKPAVNLNRSLSISVEPLLIPDAIIENRKKKKASKQNLLQAFLLILVAFLACTFIYSYFPRIYGRYHSYKTQIKNINWSKVSSDLRQEFEIFQRKFEKKSYDSKDELATRFKAFEQSFYQVQILNALNNSSHEINEFSDWTEEEIKNFLLSVDHYTNLRAEKDSFIRPINPILSKALTDEYPAHLDWREKGVVTPVKAQGKCGSCWAFATAATVESAYAIAHKELRSLSEQELLDCNLNNNACNGGNVARAFRFVHEHGLMLESEYPYVAHRQNSCALAGETTKIDTAYFLDRTEADMIDWLVNFGPVNIGISVTQPMMSYKSGVFRPSDYDCKQKVIGLHALLVVGYGQTVHGEKYWIVKNSWGQNWGTENGYVYFARGVNACGIEDEPIGLLA